MASIKGPSPAAEAYAQAVMELISSDEQAKDVDSELQSLGGMMGDDPTFRSFLLDPSINVEQRGEVLERTFRGRSSELVVNLLGVLNKKNRAALLPEIAAAFRERLDRRLNMVRVELKVAEGLDEQQMAEVQQRISIALGKTAILEQKVDDAIIGGLILRVKDSIMDASVKSQLDAIRKRMLSGRAGA
jgi:F-type H+-transporting ATPase subunit delta